MSDEVLALVEAQRMQTALEIIKLSVEHGSTGPLVNLTPAAIAFLRRALEAQCYAPSVPDDTSSRSLRAE